MLFAVVAIFLLADDVLSLEGQAVFHAPLIARPMGFDSLVVEMDCATLFRALMGNSDDSQWSIASIVCDILLLRDSFMLYTYSLVPHSVNKATNWIARRVLEGSLPPSGDLPP